MVVCWSLKNGAGCEINIGSIQVTERMAQARFYRIAGGNTWLGNSPPYMISLGWDLG
jgi:hypothetical protein